MELQDCKLTAALIDGHTRTWTAIYLSVFTSDGLQVPP